MSDPSSGRATNRHSGQLPASFSGPGVMLISAAIFGYFGFLTTWITTSGLTGEFLFFVALLEWTLKVSTIGFVVAALMTFAKPFAGNMLFALIGIAGAASLLVVGILDVADTQHTTIHPLLVFLFAAWNGYSSWTSLRALVASRSQGAPSNPSPPETPFGTQEERAR